MLAAGGLIARVAGAPMAAGVGELETGAFGVELTPGALGLGEEAIFIGRISGVSGGEAIAQIDFLGGELGSEAFGIVPRLANIARAGGATSLRVQTSRIVEITGTLQRFLVSRGFQTLEGGGMFKVFPL